MTITERITASHALLDDVLNQVELEGKKVAAIVGLFSGGNDSTTLGHLFRNRVDYFAHANTQVGIEQTRQYVRDTCKAWDRPLLEGTPVAGRTFEDLVLGQAYTTSPRAKYPVLYPGGFPGHGAHAVFFAHLKEGWMERVRKMLIGNVRKERVVFLGGRRAAESKRRKGKLVSKGAVNRTGNTIWVEPIANWTHKDIADYRAMCHDCPRNEVSDLLHMSGECLCGCYAHPGEYNELQLWFPGMTDYLDTLAARLKKRQLDIAPHTLQWGWNRQGSCTTGLCNS